MTIKYDAIIVLGSQPDPVTWQFPKQIYTSLDSTIELFNRGVAPVVITSGDHTINFDFDGIDQPSPECDMLAEYLRANGFDSKDILTERHSKDSISNLYYLKKEILLPNNMTNVLFVVASFRIPRLQFLCAKILGPQFMVSFEPVLAEQGSTYDEESTIRRQREFLAPMKDGDSEWLADKFYSDPFYGRSYSEPSSVMFNLVT